MLTALRSTLMITLVLSAAACGAPSAKTPDAKPKQALTSIDVREVVGDRAVRGLSLVGDELDLIVDGRGILRVNQQGALIAEHKVGEQGLIDRAYNDVASLEQGAFVLLSDAEGYLYDPATSTMNVHFCVEPGFEEPVVIQRNDAVAVSGTLILAAPRFYTFDEMGNERLTESALRTYRADDGEPLASVDLTAEGLELKGLAHGGDEILGVQGDELVRFSLAGELVAREPLEGVEDASGIAFDLASGSMFVADALHDVVRVFGL